MALSIHHQRYRALRTALAALRLDAGFTQTQLAQSLGVGQSYISKVERGETYVDIMLFIDWCVACGALPGVELDRIFPRTELASTALPAIRRRAVAVSSPGQRARAQKSTRLSPTENTVRRKL